MSSAGIRDLKNNLSRYLRRLKDGEIIAVTDRGRIVAELRAAKSGSPTPMLLTGGYARLVAEGAIRPAQQSGDPLGGVRTDAAKAAPRGTVAALIREDRGE